MSTTPASTPSLSRSLRGQPTLASVAALLDPLPLEERARQVRSLSPGGVRALWDLASAGKGLGVFDVAPTDTSPGQVAVWAGKNTMPLFSVFEKRFFRDRAGRIWGWNHQVMSPVTGPGYFLVRAHPDHADELLFDYTQLPREVPASLPPVKDNGAGFSYFVYRNLMDEMRRVCDGVIVGRATNNPFARGQYFALVRQQAVAVS